jgi:TnpA family transposase
MDELDEALGDLEGTLKRSDGPVRLNDEGELVISPLTAENIPSEAEDLHTELERMLPNVPIASLLVEMDRHTGFLDCFTHAGGKQSRSPQLKRNLIAYLIGLSTNLGLHGMAASCGIPYDVLAWTAEWYIREETLREANICLVNYHHKLPMTSMFGSGTLSSSDGQRFPTRGKSITARHLNKYFVSEGISTYTHVSDQHSTFGTKVIVATHREARYVLDEILGNATDLPITEHATDTHGVTLVNFGLFDLVGKQLSPRIRDLGKITLYRMGARADYEQRFPTAGPLLTKKANLDLVADHWDDLLRLAGSLKYGHATASLVVGKLSASSRQNALASALKEYGAIRRTIYAANYLSDPVYRRKIARQLNKGESLHSLRRQLHYAREGKVTRRQPEQQNEQAWCLTVVTNAVVCGTPSTWAWPWVNCAAPAARWTPRSWPTSPRPAVRWSTTTVPSPSTTNANSPSSTRRATGRCGPWPPTTRRPGCRTHRPRRRPTRGGRCRGRERTPWTRCQSGDGMT